MGLDKFVDWVVVLWGVPSLVAAGVFYLLYRTLKTAGSHQGDKDWLAQKAKRMHRPYKATLEAVLQWLERVLKPETVEDNPEPSTGFSNRLMWHLTPRSLDDEQVHALRNRPWSWPVITTAIKLSVIYTVLFSGIQWAATGSQLTLGTSEFFPSPDEINGIRFGVEEVVPSIIVGLYATSLAFRFFINISTSSYISKGWTVSAIATFILTGAFALENRFAFLFALGFGTLFASGFTFAFMLTIALAYAFPPIFPIGMIAGFYLSALAVRNVRLDYGAQSYFGLLLIICVAIFPASVKLPAAHGTIFTWLFGLVLLPSINAIFDWLSYGWTIFLLQWGRQKKGIAPFLAGLADIAVAAVIFALLATTLVIVFAQINLLRGEVLVDVQAILDDPGSHVWVVAMVASTLLPTLVHLGLAALSVITWVPLPFWGGLVARLDPEQSAVLSNLSAAALALSLMVLYALPIVAIGGVLWLLWQHSGWVLDGYLWWLQLVLDWMGSPPTVVSA